jgi:hypothetical protein
MTRPGQSSLTSHGQAASGPGGHALAAAAKMKPGPSYGGCAEIFREASRRQLPTMAGRCMAVGRQDHQKDDQEKPESWLKNGRALRQNHPARKIRGPGPGAAAVRRGPGNPPGASLPPSCRSVPACSSTLRCRSSPPCRSGQGTSFRAGAPTAGARRIPRPFRPVTSGRDMVTLGAYRVHTHHRRVRPDCRVPGQSSADGPGRS